MADETVNKKHDIQFISFIHGLATQGMMQLGKIMHPETGKLEKSLVNAKITIDMLEMLQAKTKGNLSDQEDRMLQEILTNLRLNYVDEMNQAGQDTDSDEAATEDQPESEGTDQSS